MYIQNKNNIYVYRRKRSLISSERKEEGQPKPSCCPDDDGVTSQSVQTSDGFIDGSFVFSLGCCFVGRIRTCNYRQYMRNIGGRATG